MDARLIRKKFLEYFESKGHQIVPSAPLVNKNDPTLMFTNAGMNQFKDFFLGNKAPEEKRLTDTQKCLRVSGKHNDLEEVGMDTYHHTLFEMLGNWSFGDYFKKEAIEWAWELLTQVYDLQKDRIYVTVFEGDTEDGLEKDTEAYEYWSQIIEPERILDGNKDDNFWEMGETGPCGPCSEIHIDLRTSSERQKVDGKKLVNQDHPLVVEIWNLVFIQYNRMASGNLENLPERHIDTGMGFERLCMAIQGKESNYDTDVFTPLIDYIAQESGTAYGKDAAKDIAMRVMADHIRAITFAITDGQLPSNTGAGYVIRRILRRAVRYANTFLEIKEPFLYQMVPLLAKQFDEVFPELKPQQEFVANVIREEETSFLRTLENGLKKLNQVMDELKITNEKKVDGKVAFELSDTFGFPLDLTSLIARENGYTVDEKGFDLAMKEQKNRSKVDAAKETGDWITVQEGEGDVFVGYDHVEVDTARITKYRAIKKKNKEIVQLVLDKTPFYAESGGQVGDVGHFEIGEERIKIFDTQKENGLIVHYADKLPVDLMADVRGVINSSKRKQTTSNHSATHLLHAALRQVLGKHVEQKGSLVNEKILRFDFSHFSKLTTEEIKEVEDIVNQKIRENILLDEKREVPIEEAMKMGAMALFGEKYGDDVRVISFDSNFSVELCGGTHVTATGSIGLFKLMTESSVAAGVRRIEAITGLNAEKYVAEQLDIISEVKLLLKNPKDLKVAVSALLDEKNHLEKEIAALHQQKAQAIKKELIQKIQVKDGNNLIIEKVAVPNKDVLQQLAYDLKKQQENLFLVLAANVNGKPQIAVMISDELIQQKELHAGNIVRDLSKEIKGGGGGQSFFAIAGGKDLSGLDKVIEKAKNWI